MGAIGAPGHSHKAPGAPDTRQHRGEGQMRIGDSYALESTGAGLERPGLGPGHAPGVDTDPPVTVPRYYKYVAASCYSGLSRK